MAMLLSRQKPMARVAVAWWPGGRTRAKPVLATCHQARGRGRRGFLRRHAALRPARLGSHRWAPCPHTPGPEGMRPPARSSRPTDERGRIAASGASSASTTLGDARGQLRHGWLKQVEAGGVLRMALQVVLRGGDQRVAHRDGRHDLSLGHPRAPLLRVVGAAPNRRGWSHRRSIRYRARADSRIG